MSHEIRIVRGDQVPAQEQPLTREAVTPARVRVKKTEGDGVEITWADGRHSAFPFPFLRYACPCATCEEEREAAGRPAGEPPPRKVEVFALYQAPPRPVEVTPVGRYALQFQWNDGHTSGIYSWEYLRRLHERSSGTAAAQQLEERS